MNFKEEGTNLLSKPNKGIEHSQNILTKTWRSVLSKLNIDLGRFNMLMVNYLNDPKNRVPRDTKERSTKRGNLAKELFKSKMTWSNFESAMKFIRAKKVTFNITIELDNGKIINEELVVVDNTLKKPEGYLGNSE